MPRQYRNAATHAGSVSLNAMRLYLFANDARKRNDSAQKQKGWSLDEAPRKALESSELASYFRRYISNVAPCQTTAPSARAAAEMYHTRCIRLLIDLDPEDVLIKKGVALASTCLLRSYEILAEGHDPNRHLKGAFSLASQLQDFIDHPARGLIHSGFWNYLREDITFSLFGNCPLKINLDPVPRLRNVLSDQDYLNAVSLVLGRIINALIETTDEKIRDRWETTLSYVEDWLSTLPTHFTPFSRATLPSLSGLPTVHMLKACHAASRHYCLVSLAMLAIHAQTAIQVKRLVSLALSMSFLAGTIIAKDDLLEHIGLEICGIAFASNEPSVLVNAFGPISYCDETRARVSLSLDDHDIFTVEGVYKAASRCLNTMHSICRGHTLLRASLAVSRRPIIQQRLLSTQSLPQVVRPSAEEIKSKRLSKRNLEIAVRGVHLDGLVVVEGVVPHEHLDHLNTKMVEDARVLQARGEDGPFNYNVGNIQQDAPPYAEYFYPSIFTSCVARIGAYDDL
ncbi:hypothetical protein CIB48_g8780 [Xylaria polymorpha]|nr:hypothetical protein CIB48_g8780 [Xylaria polymorpha]